MMVAMVSTVMLPGEVAPAVTVSVSARAVPAMSKVTKAVQANLTAINLSDGWILREWFFAIS